MPGMSGSPRLGARSSNSLTIQLFCCMGRVEEGDFSHARNRRFKEVMGNAPWCGDQDGMAEQSGAECVAVGLAATQDLAAGYLSSR